MMENRKVGDYHVIQVKPGSDRKENARMTGKKRLQVPVWEKGLLTLEEASEYTGIGMQKLREISNDDNCSFVLWNGTKRMFKRKKLEAYLDMTYSL